MAKFATVRDEIHYLRKTKGFFLCRFISSNYFHPSISIKRTYSVIQWPPASLLLKDEKRKMKMWKHFMSCFASISAVVHPPFSFWEGVSPPSKSKSSKRRRNIASEHANSETTRDGRGQNIPGPCMSRKWVRRDIFNLPRFWCKLALRYQNFAIY